MKTKHMFNYLYLYNNTPSNAIVNAASRPLIQADVTYRCFAVPFMIYLTNVVIDTLGKLVHKQNCSHDFYFITYNINIVKQINARERYSIFI